jgi:mannose-6-phosphate isomerase-like protein (cupin superfamily)
VCCAPITASAIETYSTSPFHQPIAKAIVPDRNNEQLYFTVVAGIFWTSDQRYTDSDGIYYQFTGNTDLAFDGKRTTLQPGDGMFIQAGSKFTLRPLDANRSPTYLEFLLSSTPGEEPVNDANWASRKLYRSPTPVPGLTYERNLLSLTRVPVPPQSPPDPLHRRTGAALHYILSGVGAEFGEGRTTPHGPGSVSFEPAGFSYQWSNPGLEPLIYLLFNVNPKSLAEVVRQENQYPVDPVSNNPRLLAIYCVALSIPLLLIVTSGTIADYHREKQRRSGRDDDGV